MGSADRLVTVATHPGTGVASMHRAALVAAARAHSGEVVSLVGAGGHELARAGEGVRFMAQVTPAWRLDSMAPAPRSVALLDRDGTVIEDRHYLADPDGVSLLPGAVAGLQALSAHGVQAVVLTNQSGVARGRITPAQLSAVHDRFQALLGMAGVSLAGIFTCPHGPDDGCPCRKPADGLAREAAGRLGFRLAEAVVVGDKPTDLELGHRLGVPAILVGTGEGPATLQAGAVQADYVVDDLSGLAGLLSHPAGLPVPARVGT
jgi:histidinol-phosphate phosphatase family protein